MAEREKSMVINAPIAEVFNMWTHFPDFPNFMTHIKDVKLLSPTQSHWTVELAGMPLEFDAEITEIKENEHLAWKSTSGIENSGFIHCEEVPEGTKLTVHLNYMPQSYPAEFTEKLGVGQMVENQIQEDLDNLKSKIEGKMAEAA